MTRSGAAQLGAWETFFTQANADAWVVYDYLDEGLYYASWVDDLAGGGYALTYYSADSPVSFYADVAVADGAFVGDYSGAGISGIACDVFIGDLDVLASLGCSVYANGPYGPDYYYSGVYLPEDFEESGWWSLYYGLDEPWYYDDGTSWVQVDARSLTLIEELNFDFFPVGGSASELPVGIDNVKLLPPVVAPPLSSSLVTGVPQIFRLAFTPGPDLRCKIESMDAPPALTWSEVVGQAGISGPDEHVFMKPVGSGSELFRVVTEPVLIKVVTP